MDVWKRNLKNYRYPLKTSRYFLPYLTRGEEKFEDPEKISAGTFLDHKSPPLSLHSINQQVNREPIIWSII